MQTLVVVLLWVGGAIFVVLAVLAVGAFFFTLPTLPTAEEDMEDWP